MTSLDAAVADARAKFAAAGLPDVAMEARILIGGLMGLTSTEVFTGGDRRLTAAETKMVADAVARRLKREPVHRILGFRDFHGMTLALSAGTLEPRPDTEMLVDTLLTDLRRIVAARGAARILDLGTGTGAIVLALLKECPEAQGVGTDVSPDALRTACSNAERLGLDGRFAAIRSDWFEDVAGRFDLIVSNPPYIRKDVIAELEPEVRDFDPALALDGGPDGLDAYRAIAAGANAAMLADGILGVEIGFDQKVSVTEIFAAAGLTLRQAVRDYGDNDRVLIFTPKQPGP